jgi:murein DD-endopeptidase MepM/ murein hydrolase activator NlpD
MKLELFWPVKPAPVSQSFGVNGAYYLANGIPIAGHNGIDFAATHGQPSTRSA